MSAFDDYCIVCEKICQNGSAYCSEKCKVLDQEHMAGIANNNDTNTSINPNDSPNLYVYSNSLPSIHGSFSLQNSKSLTNTTSFSNNNSNNTIPTIISPLLTPQIIPRCSITGSIKSPNLKDLTYESPLLATSIISNDLDSNRLDLNNSNIDTNTITPKRKSISISQRLSKSFKKKDAHSSEKSQSLKLNMSHHHHHHHHHTTNNNNNIETNNIDDQNLNNNSSSKSHSSITNVSNLLHSSSENYKKWLSIH